MIFIIELSNHQTRFVDDVIEASDGNIYFSVGSTKFSLHNSFLDLLEARPHGQLLKYNPMSNETAIVLDDLFFANGVALSRAQSYSKEEFDPGSEETLAICLTHASRTLFSGSWVEGKEAPSVKVACLAQEVGTVSKDEDYLVVCETWKGV